MTAGATGFLSLDRKTDDGFSRLIETSGGGGKLFYRPIETSEDGNHE
ncbi:hypothetical protein [Glycomyces buryatensis]|nr:hypothetical protein [Glycomyces buryatensis]